MGGRWREWADNLQRFLVASGVKDESQKRETLLYTAGKEVRDLYKQIHKAVAEEDKLTLKDLIDEIALYFTGRDNVVFSRYQFRGCIQHEGEPIDAWYSRLCEAAESCQFDTLKDSLVRDQIVACCHSAALRKRLLNVPNITLADSLKLARTHEAANQQAAIMEGLAAATEESVQALRYRQQESAHRTRGRQMESTVLRCIRCGRQGHRECDRARGKRCNKCGKPDHFARACLGKSSSINAVQQGPDRSSDEEVFHIPTDKHDDATFEATINQRSVNVLIDSGASCNVMDNETFERLKGAGLRRCHTRVYSVGSRNPLPLMGEADLPVQLNGKTRIVTFIVTRDDCRVILGRSTSVAFDMLQMGPLKRNAIAAMLSVPEHDDTHGPSSLRLKSILAEFDDRFQGIGCVVGVSIDVQLMDNAQPVCHPPSRVPIHLRPAVEKELRKQLEAGIVERVHGPTAWCSRMVVVPKPESGEVRITQDLRNLNKYVVPEKQPIPTFEEVTDEMAGSCYFSKLDIAKAFHQISVAKSSRHFFTFSSPLGLLRLRRLCMGFTSASEILQRVMSSVLSGLKGVRWIHDDIIIFGKTLEEHNRSLRECLTRLRSANITLNAGKCHFAAKEANFLSMRLSAAGIHPTEEKLRAISSFKEPANPTEVRSFLGLVNFVAKFIKNLADKARTLRMLTKKGQPWRWSSDERQAFEDIKRAISSTSSLAFYDCRLETRLIVDASPVGVGAILAQVQPNGTLRPVSYASRSLSDTEQRYSQVEREALAVKFGCLKFNHYLSGSSFRVITDHKPLVYLFAAGSRPPPRIERMALRIQDLRFSIEYQPGANNPADVLSRQPLPCPSNNVGENANRAYVAMVMRAATPVALDLETIQTASREDRTVRAAAHAIRTGCWDNSNSLLRPLRGMQHEFSQLGDALLVGDRLFIPAALRYRCLQLAHSGHQGVQKTLGRLKTKVWWPQMRASVESYVAMCVPCAACSKDATQAAPLKPTELPEGPWLELGIDFLGPIRGKMLLVCTDLFSRFPLVEIFSGTTAASAVISCLRRWFGLFGQPLKVTTDNGPPFTSLELRQFLKDNGVKHRRVTPLYPQANGATERCNRGLNKAIRAALAEGKDWTIAMEQYLAAYRRTPHAMTGAAPADLMFGRQVNDLIPALRPSRPVQATREAIVDQDASSKAAMKKYADRRRGAREHRIRPGDKVLRRRHNRKKTDTFFECDPWEVSEVRGDRLVMRRGSQQCARHVTDTKKLRDSEKEECSGEEGGHEADAGIGERSHPRAAKECVSYKEDDLRKRLG